MPLAIFGADAAVSLLNRAFTNSSPSNALFNNQVSNAKSLLPAGANASNSLSYVAFAKEFGAAYANQTADALSTLLLTNMGLLPNADLQTGLKDYITANGVGNIGIIALQLGGLISTLESATGDLAVYNAAAKAWNAEVTDAFTYSINPASTTTLSGNDATAPVVTTGQTFTYAENQAKDFAVGTVKATDVGEGGKAGTISKFEITTGNTDGFFAINATTGAITLTEAGAAAGKASNDFETAPNQFKLGVVATDAAGNKSTAGEVTINVTDVDDVGPKLAGSSASGTTVKLNFDEALKATVINNPSAAFTVSQGSTSFSVNTAVISGNTVTLTLAATLAAGDTNVAYSGTVLEDAQGNKTAAIAATKVTSSDTTAPTLLTSSPLDNATSFANNSNIELTFSEDVVAGTGSITVVNTADATDTRTINVLDTTQVTVSGTKVTVNPAADLKAGGTYAVNVGNAAVLDKAGNAYAGIADNTTLNFTASGAAVAGGTTVLTKSVQATAGTTGNDIFIAGDEGGSATLNAGDQITGDTGTDTLKIYNTAAVTNAANLALAVVTGIEAVEATFGLSAQTLSVSGNADVKTVTVVNGFDGVVTLKAAQTAGLTGTIDTTTAQTSFAFSDVTGGADTVSLALSDAKLLTAAGAAGKGVVIAGVETLNIAATGTNALNNTTLAATTKIVISGTGSLSTTLDQVAGVTKTIDATAASGALNINNAAAAAAVESIKLGSGNDTYRTNYANLTAADVIEMGVGTDSLRFADVATFNDATTGATLTKVTGVEQLGTVNTKLTIDGSFVSQTSYYTESSPAPAAPGGQLALSNIANGADVNFGAGTILASTIGLKLGASTLNVNLAGSTTVASDVATGLTVTGSSTINVKSTGTDGVSNNVLALTASENQAVVITGAQNTTLTTTAAAPGLTGFSIDGSAATGKLTVTGTTATDVVKGGSAADTLSGGTGAVADTLTGNAGADKFIVIAGITAATADVITDFVTKSDTISFGSAVLAANYSEGSAPVADFAAAKAAADLVLTSTAATQVNVQQVGADSWVFFNNGVASGADQVVKLTGVALTAVEAADIVA